MGTGRMHSLISGTSALVLYDRATPADADWLAWMAAYQTHAKALRALMVFSLGGSPSATQRTEMNRFLQSRADLHRTAVVTASPLVRGIVTAMNWFLRPELRSPAFAPGELEAASDYLQLDAATRTLFRRTIEQKTQVWAASASQSV